MSDAAPEGAEKAGIDVISTSPNAQLPSGIAAPPVSETASTLASLRMVCLRIRFLLSTSYHSFLLIVKNIEVPSTWTIQSLSFIFIGHVYIVRILL